MTLKEVSVMVSEKQEIRRELRVLKHAETAGRAGIAVSAERRSIAGAKLIVSVGRQV